MRFGKLLVLVGIGSFFAHGIVGMVMLFLAQFGALDVTGTTMPWWIWAWFYGSVVVLMVGMAWTAVTAVIYKHDLFE